MAEAPTASGWTGETTPEERKAAYEWFVKDGAPPNAIDLRVLRDLDRAIVEIERLNRWTVDYYKSKGSTEMATITPETPRRMHIEAMTPPELAIRRARMAVEKMPADTRLTEAGELLRQAQEKVADYIDHQDSLKKEPWHDEPAL